MADTRSEFKAILGPQGGIQWHFTNQQHAQQFINNMTIPCHPQPICFVLLDHTTHGCAPGITHNDKTYIVRQSPEIYQSFYNLRIRPTATFKEGLSSAKSWKIAFTTHQEAVSYAQLMIDNGVFVLDHQSKPKQPWIENAGKEYIIRTDAAGKKRLDAAYLYFPQQTSLKEFISLKDEEKIYKPLLEDFVINCLRPFEAGKSFETLTKIQTILQDNQTSRTKVYDIIGLLETKYGLTGESKIASFLKDTFYHGDESSRFKQQMLNYNFAKKVSDAVIPQQQQDATFTCSR